MREFIEAPTRQRPRRRELWRRWTGRTFFDCLAKPVGENRVSSLLLPTAGKNRASLSKTRPQPRSIKARENARLRAADPTFLQVS
jgi:hypothetical protein